MRHYYASQEREQAASIGTPVTVSLETQPDLEHAIGANLDKSASGAGRVEYKRYG